MLSYNYTIDKANNVIKSADNKKVELVYFSDKLLIVKIHGSSGYVHRGIGVIYTPAHYSVNEIINIVNTKCEILIQTKNIKEIEVKGQSNYISEFINTITLDKKEISYLDLIHQRDRDIIMKRKKEFEDFSGSIHL